jgi:xanthine dehydrogenase accessory factor
MYDWRDRLIARVSTGPVVMVTVIATEGSTPRETGARMLVYAGGQDGSIGGGRLEFQEVAAAQTLLAQGDAPWLRDRRRTVLGPDAGQCCGGVVEVLHELITDANVSAFASADVFERPVVGGIPIRKVSCGVREQRTIWTEERDGQVWLIETSVPDLTPLYIYGAGHVARALVYVLRDLPFAVDWVDIDVARFPATTDGTRRVVTVDPAAVARAAPPDAVHLIMTHDHDLDATICDAVLRRGDFAFLGLIGSATKRARFAQRFRRSGISDGMLDRLVCPIGRADIVGKEPAVIAISIAAQLIALGNPAT